MKAMEVEIRTVETSRRRHHQSSETRTGKPVIQKQSEDGHFETRLVHRGSPCQLNQQKIDCRRRRRRPQKDCRQHQGQPLSHRPGGKPEIAGSRWVALVSNWSCRTGCTAGIASGETDPYLGTISCPYRVVPTIDRLYGGAGYSMALISQVEAVLPGTPQPIGTVNSMPYQP